MTKSIVLFTLLTPSIAFASVVNLECALSSEQSRHNMVLFVDLDKTKQEATITKESGAPYKAKALLSTDYIQLKKVRIGPPGILDVEKYTVDRNTLAITVTPKYANPISSPSTGDCHSRVQRLLRTTQAQSK